MRPSRRIGRAVQTRAYLVAETRPRSRPIRRFRFPIEVDSKSPRSLRGRDRTRLKSLHRTPLASGAALSHQEIRIARVHDQIVLVGGDGIQDLVPQDSPIEPCALQGKVGVLPVHVAVPGVEHVERRLDPAACAMAISEASRETALARARVGGKASAAACATGRSSPHPDCQKHGLGARTAKHSP